LILFKKENEKNYNIKYIIIKMNIEQSLNVYFPEIKYLDLEWDFNLNKIVEIIGSHENIFKHKITGEYYIYNDSISEWYYRRYILYDNEEKLYLTNE